MKKPVYRLSLAIVLGMILISISLTDCKKVDTPQKYTQGTFPDSVRNLSDINSSYDDYNLNILQFEGYLSIIFSSNRGSSGGQFDLEQAVVSYSFGQTDGSFTLETSMANDAFLTKLINKAKTAGNDFGPYSLFSSIDGFDYFFISSVNAEGNLDLYYLKNHPVFGSTPPDIDGPYPVKLLNTGNDDAYICFDSNLDSAYFISNQEGNFDIYMHQRPSEQDFSSWLNKDYEASTKVDSLNSSGDDKCPFIFKNLMVFASNRPGGMGGFDLYYSIFRNGKWNSPVNLGPDINTSSDEYRPVLGYDQNFTNLFLMFSSNRVGGKGGFDLYFKGI